MRVDFFGIWLKAENEYDSEENIVGQMGNRHMAAVGCEVEVEIGDGFKILSQ